MGCCCPERVGAGVTIPGAAPRGLLLLVFPTAGHDCALLMAGHDVGLGAEHDITLWWQGMTVGILGALELQQLLAARLAGCQPEPAATTAALVGLGTVGFRLALFLLSVTNGVTVVTRLVHPMPSVVLAMLVSHLALEAGRRAGLTVAYTPVPVYVQRGGRVALHAVPTKRVHVAHGMCVIGCMMSMQEFQPKLAKVQDFPWSVATADDAVRHVLLSHDLCKGWPWWVCVLWQCT